MTKLSAARPWVLASVLSAGLPLTGPAQEPPRDRFGEEVRVVEVLLDVTVTDRRGNLILGLAEEDFRVELGGEVMEITSCEFRSSRRFQGNEEHAARLGLSRQSEPERRYFVLLFHDLMRSDWETMGLTARQAEATLMSREWVREDLLPNDWVAVASFDTKLKVHQDFTRDRDALDRALKRAMMRREPKERVPPGHGSPSLLRHLPRGTELRDLTGSIRHALWALAHALQPLDGRKNLMLFSPGVGITSSLAPVLNRSNVDVYTLDLTPPDYHHMQSTALRAMAMDTDGGYFQWRSFLESLRSVSERTSGFYLLSFRAPEGMSAAELERRLRKLRVEVPDPSFRVEFRRRYVRDVETRDGSREEE